MNVYGPRIAAARKVAGLTQQQLADALGVNAQTIKRRESANGKEPKKVDRIAIAAVCGVSLDYMEGVIADVESATDGVVRALRAHDDHLNSLDAAMRKLATTVAQQSRELRELRDQDHRKEPPGDEPR